MRPGIRATLALAALLLLGSAYLSFGGYRAWRDQMNLMEQPTVEAYVAQGGDQIIAGRPVPSGAPVWIEFTLNGKPMRVMGWLADTGKGKKVLIGDRIPVHVDPADPNHWTSQTEPPRLSLSLAPGAAALAFALIALVAAWMARWPVLRTWREGECVPAEVVGWQQSPLAPRSRVARCVRLESDDRRVFRVYVPRSAIPPEGEAIYVLVHPRGGPVLHEGWGNVQ